MGMPALQEEYCTSMRLYRLLPPRVYSQIVGLLPAGAEARAAASSASATGSTGAEGGGKGRAASSSGPGGKGRRRWEESRSVLISKALTQVLRHKASALQLHIRPDGYMPLQEVLGCSLLQKFRCTLQEVEQIVRDSDKQRFTLTQIDDVWHIRANQGHSLKEVLDEELLERLQIGGVLPEQVVHGTYLRHWASIRDKGLLAGGNNGQKFRNHVHFAVGLPKEGNVISGMRQTCELAIYLDVQRALEQGLPLYRSENEVILSPGFDGAIPSKFFLKVVRLKDGVQLWPEPRAGESGDN